MREGRREAAEREGERRSGHMERMRQKSAVEKPRDRRMPKAGGWAAARAKRSKPKDSR